MNSNYNITIKLTQARYSVNKELVQPVGFSLHKNRTDKYYCGVVVLHGETIILRAHKRTAKDAVCYAALVAMRYNTPVIELRDQQVLALMEKAMTPGAVPAVP
jgi:hypothetical protein